jgi:hypothetical protein
MFREHRHSYTAGLLMCSLKHLRRFAAVVVVIAT